MAMIGLRVLTKQTFIGDSQQIEMKDFKFHKKTVKLLWIVKCRSPPPQP